MSRSLTKLLTKPDKGNLDKTCGLFIGILVAVVIVVYISVPILNYFFLGWVTLPRKIDKRNYLWLVLDSGFNRIGQSVIVLVYLVSCFAVGLTNNPKYFQK